MPQRLVNYSQAAKLTCLHPVTLRRLVMLEKIPFYKIGGSVRFDPDELLRQSRHEAKDVKGGDA